MIARSKSAGFLLFSILAFCLAWTASPPPLVAQDVVVSQASPSSAPQGSVNLNVRVKGNGFKKGAIAKWLVTGTTDPGGVTVNSTTYVSATDLIANITVAAGAQTDKKFDIKVTLSNGRTGKGIELFSVIVNPPDPAIAFVAEYQQRNDLMVMNADGTNQRTVLSQQLVEIQNPVWSPDGTQVAFCRLDKKANQTAIYVVNRDGSDLRKVNTPNNIRVSYTNKTSWSPVPLADGQYKIAFSGNVILPGGSLAPQSDIFIVNLDGSGLTQLTNTPDIKEWDVYWSPTADRIAISAYDFVVENDPGRLPVYRIDYVSGQFTATLLIDLALAVGSPLDDKSSLAWANTQDKIAVSARIPGSYYRIWIVDLTNPTNLVNITQSLGGTFESQPSWSPDDSQIVYLGYYPTMGSKEGIWVIDSDGSGPTRIASPTSTFWYGSPDWRRCCPTCVTVCGP